MTQQEYEQKKRECWEWFIGSDGFPTETIRQCFNFAFDRAYALGKVKDLISQDEIDEAAEDYVSFEKGGKCYPSYIVERACCCAFKDGANYALGKQETKQETKQEIVIRGWVTFDDCIYECFLHTTKPVRKNVQIDDGVYQMEWRSEGLMYILDPNLFPDMDSDSEPQEVELIIKRKKNG